MNSHVEIRPLKLQDIPAIIKISNAQLGHGYIDETKLKKLIDNDGKSMCVVASIKDKIIGFCSYDIFTYEQVLEFIKEDVELFKGLDRIGYIRSLAIAPHIVKKGLGTALIAQVVANLFKMGVYHMFAGAWKPGNNANAGKALERNQFRKLKEVKDYYYEESINTNFICPCCGPICHCAVIFYIR